MDEEHQQLNALLTRTADAAGRFEAPPVEVLVRRGRRRSRLRALTAVSTVAAAVVAVAVGLSVAGPLRHSGRGMPSPTSTASTPSLPGSTGPTVGVSALTGYRWSALPAAPIPVRGEAASAWTGRALIVWGGQTPDGRRRSDGAIYDPAGRTWTALPPGPLTARANPLSAWVGGSFVIWGGDTGGIARARDGARYDPRAGTWSMLPAVPVASYSWARLVVADDRAVLLSAEDGDPGIIHVDAYDPAANTWRAMPDLRTARTHRVLDGAALGVGDIVFVWSDWFHTTRTSSSTFSTDSGVDTYALDTRTATWSPVPVQPDKGRDVGQPIWTGTHFLLTGEDIYCGPCSHPGGTRRPTVAIDPRTGARTPIPNGPLSVGITSYYWTGSALLALDLSTEVSGSTHDDMYPGDAAAWDPDTNTWTTLANTRISGGSDAVTAWTGTRLLVWGLTGTHGDTQPAGLQFAPHGS